MMFEVFISLLLMVLSSLWLGYIYLHVANDFSVDYNSIFSPSGLSRPEGNFV